MKHAAAVAFLRPALEAEPGPAWADLGAGRGTFTEALAGLLGPEGRIVAVDNDPSAVRALRRVAAGASDRRAPVVVVEGDLRSLGRLPAFEDVELDGVLLANVLHFFADPDGPLVDAVHLLRPGGRVVVIEYEGRSPGPWLPHPLSFERLRGVAVRAGLDEPRVVGRRDSAYRGAMYCAVAERPAVR